MAAALHEQPVRLQTLYCIAEIDTPDRTARTLAKLPVKPDDDCWSPRLLLQARRDDPYYAGMPVVARRPDQRAVESPLVSLGKGRLTHLRLDLAALAVQLVKTFCQRPGFIGVAS